jgi:hypothetical protein
VRDIPSSTLRIIGAGFGRTGTLSLRQALLRLGFGPCDHMHESFAAPARFTLWHDALRRTRAGEAVDWRPLLEGYRATLDWPAAYFWHELAAAHPDARVILTVRDPDRWYASAEATIFRLRNVESLLWGRATRSLFALAVPEMQDGYRVVDDVIWDGTFDGRFADRRHALRVFTRHNRDVRETVPPDKLLVFDVREGWDPLCAFLGVPVPKGEPFPHVNDGAAFRRHAREQAAWNILRFGGATAAGVMGISALAWLGRSAMQPEPRP